MPRRFGRVIAAHLRDVGPPAGRRRRARTAPRLCFGRKRIETRLLLVAERIVQVIERRVHDADRLQHGLDPRAHDRKSAGRRARQVVRASGLQGVERLGGRVLEVSEKGLLIPIGLDGLGDLFYRPVGQGEDPVAADLAARGGGSGRSRCSRFKRKKTPAAAK